MGATVYKINDVNGTDLLFQTKSSFIASSLKVIQRTDGTNIDTVLDVIPMGDKYFKTLVPPPLNASLTIYYNSRLEEPIGVEGLSSWEKKNINKIMVAISYMEQSLKNMELALEKKVSVDEFFRVTTLQYEDIKGIKNLLTLSSSSP